MTLKFQVEQIVPLRDEIMPLLARHWEEIALNKDVVPLDPDWNAYNVMEKSGMVNATVARDTQRRIVGYASFFMTGNPHYRSILVASSDIFYLAPEHRRGTAGIRLLAEAEKNVIAAAQCQRDQFKFLIIVNKEKTHFQRQGRQIVGAILKRQGYSLFEHHYHRRIDLSVDVVGAQS